MQVLLKHSTALSSSLVKGSLDGGGCSASQNFLRIWLVSSSALTAVYTLAVVVGSSRHPPIVHPKIVPYATG